MGEHALCCIDAPQVGDNAAQATTLAGWCLCAKPIEAIAVEVPGLGSRELRYGLARPDVGASFGSYPNGERCGFELEVPAGSLGGDGALELTLTVKGRLGMRQQMGLRAGLWSNHIQQLQLYKKKRRAALSSDALERRLEASLQRRPGLMLRVDIINKCNLRCIMCRYVDPAVGQQPAKRLTAEEFDHFLDGIGPSVRAVMLSCADEPLTSRHFPDILSLLARKYPQMEIELCTNATLMNGKIRRLMIEKGVTHLMLSMDGTTRPTLESIRGGAKYEKVVGNILALRDLKRASGSRYPIFIMDYVLMNSNVHEAPAFVELAARMGVGMIDFRHVIPSSYFEEADNFLHNHRAKFNHYRRRILEEGRRFGVDIIIPPPFETSEEFSPEGVPAVDLSDFESVEPDPPVGDVPVPKKFPRGFKPRVIRGTAVHLFSKRIPGIYCERPFSEITILDQERILPCPWYEKPLGKVSEGKTLSEVFYGERFRQLRKSMLHPQGDPGCRNCPLKGELVMGEVTS